METRATGLAYVSIILILVLLGITSYGYISLFKLKEAHTALQIEVATTQLLLKEKGEEILNLEAVVEMRTQEFAISEENNAELARLFADEKNKNDELAKQVYSITGTVGKLSKLSKIDPELLIKYSRVYFLSENYKPEKLLEIDESFLSKPNEPKFIHAKVARFLNDLLEDAKDDDVHLFVVSGFRSFDDQMKLKSIYTTNYGTGANAFSADQGYSEHQLGTTVDFTTKELGGSLTGFDQTDAYTWLEKNAYKYGFVLSYPKDNGYYVFEPWHWRFVGKDLARELHNKEKFFYSFDQREINTYLISLFD